MRVGTHDVDPTTTVRTFLIADVRGYTRFTRERGDAEAARLATKFAGVARDSVAARRGRVIELRGDEALAVFASPAQAVRAALEFQATCLEETAADPNLPLTVGIGIDVGEAVPVEGGFRGGVLNMAARLCSKAIAGQVLMTRAVAEGVGELDDVRFENRGAAELKGFEAPVDLIEAVAPVPPVLIAGSAAERPTDRGERLPPELDALTPLVDREHEMHWLRGTRRQAGRGRGRIVFVSGPAQIGKTRLAAEVASEVSRTGGRVHYAGAGGAAAALAIAAVREAMAAAEPLLVVLDDFDVAGEDAARVLAEAHDQVKSRPVLVIALVKDPESGPSLSAAVGAADQFSDGHIVLAALDLDGGEGSIAADSECPYKGLASFEEEDAGYFFGRERLVGELAARTVQVGLLGVVGASGSGKSSVVGAGLFPSLRAGLLPGSERWRHVAFRPGEHPLAELDAVLATVAPRSSDGPALEAAVDAIGREGRLVVGVDQFEEVFTLCTDGHERDAFVGAITEAATRSPERILFVLTIRDDFYGHCAPYRELTELLIANHVLVPPMTTEELRRAIELPARRAGLRVESDLGDALVEEVGEEPGGLPLLSAALVELWQARDDGWLRMDAYERTGGVRGAVARLAEASYQQLTDEEREVARRIFLRLSGVGDGDVVTRRRVQLSEFDVEKDSVAANVLARLTRDRLLTMSDSTVEVAHEALLREWPRLRAWLEEDAQGHQLRQHLTQAAKHWEASGRDASEVYRGARLSAALDWASTRGPELNELEREFLAESRQASEREAERQRRTNRRLRGLLVGTAVFLAVALAAGGLAIVQRGRAQDEAQRAERQASVASARELASAAVANLDVDPERSILLALEAVDATWETDRTVVPEAEEALHHALQQSRVVLTVDQGGGLAVSQDGTRFATTGQGGTATVWEMETGERVLTLRGHHGALNGIAFSPDGRLLATTGDDGTARLWNAASGRQIDVLKGHRGPILEPTFSPDGRVLATTGDDATIRVWDIATGTEDMVLRGPDGETFDPLGASAGSSFSPDGSRLASGGWDRRMPIWDLATGEIVMELRAPRFGFSGVAFSPDGTRIATGTFAGAAQTWDAETGEVLTTSSGHIGEILAVDFSPDGSRIATAGSDATARVWDAATGAHVLTLAGHSTTIGHVAFTPDRDRLLTASLDGTTRMWDISLTGGRDWLTVPGPSLRMGGVAFSPDGTRLAVPEQLPGITIRDVDTGAKLITLEGHDAVHSRLAFSPDGSRLAAADATGVTTTKANWTVPIWDVNTGELVTILTGHEDDVPAVAFSPDGDRVVTSSSDGTLRLWDATSGDERRKLDVGADAFALGFSPDGRWLAAGTGWGGGLAVWDGGSPRHGD